MNFGIALLVFFLFMGLGTATILFAFMAACNRKPDVPFTQASWFSNLLNDPSLYTEEGLKARGCSMTCYYAGIAVMVAIGAWLIYK